MNRMGFLLREKKSPGIIKIREFQMWVAIHLDISI